MKANLKVQKEVFWKSCLRLHTDRIKFVSVYQNKDMRTQRANWKQMKDLYLEDVSEILMRVELSSHNVSPSRAQNTPKRLSKKYYRVSNYTRGEIRVWRDKECQNKWRCQHIALIRFWLSKHLWSLEMLTILTVAD